MNSAVFRAALVLTVALAATAPADAQQRPPIPPKGEMLKRLKEAFPKVVEKAETGTTEVEGLLKLTYKKIPTDPKVIAKMLGKDMGTDKIPDQMVDQYVGMFAKEITEALNTVLQDIGEIEVLKELKLRSKKVPVGKHHVGLVFEGEKPVSFVIFDKKEEAKEKKEGFMKKPVVVRLVTSSSDLLKEVNIELKKAKKAKKGKVAVDIFVNAIRYKAKSKKPLTASAD